MNIISRQRGFTLTEIMVAVAIGLLSTLVVFKALQSSNIISQNVTNGSDASINGSIALYSLERETRMAGYGLNDASIIGCTLQIASSSVTLPTDVAAKTALLAPISIINPASNPTLRVAYAGGRSITPTKLTKAFSGSSNDIVRVANLYGLTNAGTLVLFSQEGTQNCSLMQTSKNITSATDTDVLVANSGTSPFSPSGGLGQAYSIGANVRNIGSLSFADSTIPTNIPVWKEFNVNLATETLTEKNIFTASAVTPIARNISNMYVDYILDDGTIYNPASPTATYPYTTAVQQRAVLSGIVGVRIALLARTPDPDFTKGANCKTSTAYTSETEMVTPSTSPSLATGLKDQAGNDIRFSLVRTYNPNAYCYRYKTHTTTVMLRNLAWKS